MHVDQSRQDGLAGGVDGLGVELLRVGKAALVDLGDLSAPHENRARLNYFPIADKDARVLDQPGLPAPEIARENPRLDQVVLTPRLVSAEEEEREQHHQHPKFGRSAQLFLLLPAKKLRRDKGRDSGREQERGDRLPIREERSPRCMIPPIPVIK